MGDFEGCNYHSLQISDGSEGRDQKVTALKQSAEW